jgi:PAS domain S-box-containing protein
MHGYSQEELLGKHLSVFHSPEQMPSVDAANKQIRETGSFSGEIWHVRRDGTSFPSHMYNWLLRDENGAIIGMIGTMRDITDRKREEEALREAEQRFHEIAERSTDVFWVSTADRKRAIYVSPEFEGIWNMPVEEMYENPLAFLDRIHPEDRESVIANMNGDQSLGFTSEYRVVRPDGSIRWVWSRGFPIHDAGGDTYRVAGIVTDITVQVEARQKDAEQKAALVHADRLTAIGRLAAGVAHEINNPLSVLYGMLQEQDASPESISPDEAAKMFQVAARIKRIVNDLLLFSRQTGDTKTAANLNDAVQRTVGLLKSQMDRQKVDLNLQLDPHLKEAELIEDQWQQVAMNLIFNAMDSMPDGGSLTIRTSHTDGDILLTIKDTGCGIKQEVLKQIFLPFFSTKEPDKGTGLGLSISHGIVEDHGGTINVESKPGQGSRFEIRIPALVPQESSC